MARSLPRNFALGNLLIVAEICSFQYIFKGFHVHDVSVYILFGLRSSALCLMSEIRYVK